MLAKVWNLGKVADADANDDDDVFSLEKFLFWIEIKIDFWERESGRKIGSSLGKQWNKIDRKKFNWNQSGQIGGQLNSDPFLYGVWVLYGRTYFEWRK